MKAKGTAYGAGTIINAIAAWKGSAFAIDLKTHAEVELRGDRIEGEIEGGGNTRLIERACELTLETIGIDSGAKIRTTSDIPIASGLKSSSAAANATVIATCRAVQQNMDPLDMIRIGVHAALDAGVSVTGAFDDACASMLGGVVVTDNRKKTLIKREALKSAVIVYAPDKKSFSAHTNVKKSRLIAPWVEMAFDLAIKGEYGKAMGLNGFLYCSALGYSTEPMLTALEKGVAGVSLSGTGPSYVALVSKEQAYILKEAWSEYPGRVFVTEVINEGAFLR